MQKGIILSLILVVFTGIALGQVPQLINYQGILVNPATGEPVPDGSYTIIFSIYNVASGGSAVWTESQSVQTKNGLYNVLLGSSVALTTTILSGPEKYLGIKVGADPEMTPRKRIVSVAYAILSEDANKLDGKAATEFADAIHTHDDRYYTETELNTSDGDPPNQGSNRLSWDNLKDVPAGFADGVDNVGTGGGWIDDGTVVRLETGTDMVGIGTTTPNSKLEVSGTIHSTSGGFKFPDGTTQTSAAAGGSSWNLTGNSGTVPGTHFLGTTDDRALELKVNNNHVLRLESSTEKPNLIGGYSGNSVTSGVEGAVIAGGGNSGAVNSVNGSFSTVSGGENNTASSDRAVVSGGTNNTAGGSFATIGGGFENRTNGPYNSISGGSTNTTSGQYTMISGGYRNEAQGYASTVCGGQNNSARGDYSFSAGIRAKANHQGCFVWNDASGSAPGDSIASTAENQFIARAKGGVLFTGSFGEGTIPIEGAGTRMMWYPGKAAFRVGHLRDECSPYWDADSIGDYSIAMGYNTRARRIYSIAMGGYTTASGEYSTALGFGTEANGYQSTAIGCGTNASGNQSTAIGLWTNASGEHCTAMGMYTTASGYGSTAMGYFTTANQANSTAMGERTTASGAASTATGYYTTSSGFASIAMGCSTRAHGFCSFAAGLYAKANHDGCLIWGDSSGEEADSLFSTAANQFLIRATGGVGIGTNEPGNHQLYVNSSASGVSGATAYIKNRKGLSAMDIVAVLTKVIQEQQKKIAELEARLALKK